MNSIRRIVVGVAMPKSYPWHAANLDAPTRISLRQGVRLAAELQVPLMLVTVLTPPEVGYFSSEEDAEVQASAEHECADELLRGLQEDYAAPDVTVAHRVRVGQPWLEILREAEAARDTLIICGTRDQGVLSRLMFGSTGLKLLRNSPGPVWLVKPRIDDDAVLDVLAATDLSDVGGSVISAGVTLAQALPVQLTVMHVLESDLEGRMAHTGASEDTIAGWREKDRAAAEEQLNEQVAAADARTAPSGVQTQLAEGVADSCLLAAIEELDIDLLIMASSGRNGLPGMLFGNTAERLLSEIPCSLLALKPDEFRCPVEIS